MNNLNFTLKNDVFNQVYILQFKNSFCHFEYNLSNQEKILKHIFDLIINMNSGEII
jgi:ABC-type antimicrobial peptide transport system ATPase subunit